MAAINRFLYLLIKDELSESSANFALPYLCQNIATGEFEVDYNFSIEYMKALIKNDFNAILASAFFDTYVSVWSCFENAINSITKRDEELISNKLANSKFRKHKRFIKNILLSDLETVLSPDKLDKILEEKKRGNQKGKPYLYFFSRQNELSV